MTDDEWTKFKEEAGKLKKKIDKSPRKKRWFQARYATDLDELFTDGKGPVVNTGDVGGRGGFYPSTKEITFNPKELAGTADRRMNAIAHELEHFARDSAIERGITPLRTPSEWSRTVFGQMSQLALLDEKGNRIGTGAEIYNSAHGEHGYMFVWLLFGDVNP